METLASRITREGGLQEIDAVGWAIRVAFSVEQIHALGGVHGRISADGILITSDKCTSEGRLIPFSELPENVAYHSPERERGEGGSQADDTWAVAVLLYLALSGSLPFSGAGDEEVRRKIRSVPAPPLAVFDIGDDALQGIVDRALARNRDQRTAGVGDLRRELEGWRPDACLDALPPLLTDDEPDEEVTMIHSGVASSVRAMIAAAAIATPRKPSISPPRPAGAQPATPSDLDAPPPDPAPPPALAALGTVVMPAPSAASVAVAPSKPPSPLDEDFEEATLMVRAGLKVDLPGLVDDASISDRTEDPFAIPSSRADVPHVGPASSRAPASGPASSRSPASGPASSRAPASGPRASVPPASGPAAAVPAALPAPRPSRTGLLLVCAVVIVAVIIAALLWGGAGASELPHPTNPATASTPAAQPPAMPPVTPTPASDTAAVTIPVPPAATSTASAAVSATASTAAPTVGSAAASTAASAVAPVASVAPTSTAAHQGPAPAGVAACVIPTFPPDTFDPTTDFSFVCAEADPLKGGAAIRSQLVRSHRNLSDGMKEWALLGWYELAAFSVIRARCCPSAPPLQLPEVPVCKPLPEILGGISAAATATTDPADKALKKAVDAYTSEIYCIVRSGVAARFGRVGNPQGGEDTTFMRFLGRVVAAKR